MHKFLKYAVAEANKSTFRQQVGAVLYDKNKIISLGHNTPQRSVKHMLKKYQKWPNSIHAEVAAILAAKTCCKDMEILVVRINSKNQLSYSRPCDHCMMYIQYVGIKRVYYSINEYPYIECMKI